MCVELLTLPISVCIVTTSDSNTLHGNEKMTSAQIKVGTKVICNWKEGVVIAVDGDILTVRLESGCTTAYRSEFGRYESHKVIG